MDSHLFTSVESYLHQQFHIKNLCSLKYLFGIELDRTLDGIYISRRKCTLVLLDDSGRAINSGLVLRAAPPSSPTKIGRLGWPF